MEFEPSAVAQNLSDQAPSVGIVVLNWNAWRDTVECLGSLRSLRYPEFFVVVVDNGSTDDSIQRISAAFPDILLLQSGSNLGYAGGNNIGIRRALDDGADYVWVLNNDTVVDADALTHMVTRLRMKPDAGLCGSTLVYYDDRDVVQAFGGATYNKWLASSRPVGQNASFAAARNVDEAAIESSLDYICGASTLVSRSFLEEVGLLNTDYFLYYEEIDWITRAKGRFTLAYASRSIVYHKEGGSVGASNRAVAQKSRIADYHSIRSRLLFTRKHYFYALPTVYLGLLVAVLNRARRGQWERIPMILKLALGD